MDTTRENRKRPIIILESHVAPFPPVSIDHQSTQSSSLRSYIEKNNSQDHYSPSAMDVSVSLFTPGAYSNNTSVGHRTPIRFCRVEWSCFTSSRLVSSLWTNDGSWLWLARESVLMEFRLDCSEWVSELHDKFLLESEGETLFYCGFRFVPTHQAERVSSRKVKEKIEGFWTPPIWPFSHIENCFIDVKRHEILVDKVVRSAAEIGAFILWTMKVSELYDKEN